MTAIETSVQEANQDNQENKQNAEEHFVPRKITISERADIFIRDLSTFVLACFKEQELDMKVLKRARKIKIDMPYIEFEEMLPQNKYFSGYDMSDVCKTLGNARGKTFTLSVQWYKDIPKDKERAEKILNELEKLIYSLGR
jgi:hypothetical protein